MKQTLIFLFTAAAALAGCTNRGGPRTLPLTPNQIYEAQTWQNPTWESIRTVLNPGGVLDESVAVPPTDPVMAYRLGGALEQAGQLDRAKAYYADAIKLFPDNVDLKRAHTALSGDFTGDGVPDRIEHKGVFLYFYDGTRTDWILQLQPFTGEERLRAELVDIGGPRPAIIITSPKGAHVEVYRGDGFTGLGGGETAEYNPGGRQLILTNAMVLSNQVVPRGYLRLGTAPDGSVTADLSPTSHPGP